MQKKRMQGESAKQVAIDVLRKARRPLPAREIAKRVIDSGRCAGLKGKTPEATISAMLAVGSKPGGPFKRVDKGTYTVAASNTAPSEPAGSKKRRPGAHAAATPRKKQPERPDEAEPVRREPKAARAPEVEAEGEGEHHEPATTAAA